jgi:hypothetical protein
MQMPVPHWLGMVAPHTCGLGHVPQDSVPPHPSEIVPHVAPSIAQVIALHAHRLATPAPPQVSNPAHAPQSSLPMQPSSAIPHSAPRSAHVFRLQAQTFASTSAIGIVC